MLNVFMKVSTEKLEGEVKVQLSDGRIILLEDLIRDYERLLKKECSKKAITSLLKVGEWFRINRELIGKNKEEIQSKCNEAGEKGKKLWKRFEESNKIAEKYPDQYPNLIETYIFNPDWKYKTELEMQNMCEEIGDGMCCEIICDLELQMRICNGESVDDLVKETDKLPYVRVIKFRNGKIGYFGGGSDSSNKRPPAEFCRCGFYSDYGYCGYTPYAFRRVLL